MGFGLSINFSLFVPMPIDVNWLRADRPAPSCGCVADGKPYHMLQHGAKLLRTFNRHSTCTCLHATSSVNVALSVEVW